MMEESGKEFMAKAEETGEDPEMYFLWAGEVCIAEGGEFNSHPYS